MRSFVDMEMSETEAKALMPTSVPMPESARPKYPYGLCISLGEEELKKLGLDDKLPAVGDMLHGMFMANVTSVSEREDVGSDGKPKTCCRVELQITHLATEDENRERPSNAERARARYGKDGDDE